jgi:perosamine synthetase
MTNKPYNEQAIIEIIKEVVADGSGSNHEPFTDERMSRYVEKSIKSGDFAATGQYVTHFEDQLAQITGAKFVISTNSGTSALQVLLKCAGVGPGDEVLIPAISFVATANAVSYLGATPHFLDVTFPYCTVDFQESISYLSEILVINEKTVINKKTGRTVRAIIGVHVFGHANGLSHLRNLAEIFNLPLIEDAAGALGTHYKQEHVGHGSFGGIISFNGNKTISTGGGGAILTNCEETAIRSRHLSTTAKTNQAFIHDEIGFNFRMPNINAALGFAQIQELPRLLEYQRNLFHKYATEFSGIQRCEILAEPNDCLSNYWQQTLVLDSEIPFEIEKLVSLGQDLGLSLRRLWWPLPDLNPYRAAPSMDLRGAWKCHNQLVNLPSSAVLGSF